MVELQEIFDIKYGNQFDLNKMNRAASNIHFVGRLAKNNGVTSKVGEFNKIKPYDAGLITVALGSSVLSSFLQVKPFYTGQNISVLTPSFKINDAQKLFYCKAIFSNAYRFSTCGREANRSLKTLLVPAINEIPKWVNQVDLSRFNGANKSISNNSIELDVTSWKSFGYDEIFNIERGRGPRKKDLNGAGSTPFITSTDKNNGFTNFTAMKSIHKGNTIGVNRNGSVAEAFYQSVPFCSTEDVHIFTSKFNLNQYIAMFLIALIKKEKYRYSYGRKWGIERMKKSTIKLPSNENGEPDWLFMEEYIKSLPYSSSIYSARSGFRFLKWSNISTNC